MKCYVFKVARHNKTLPTKHRGRVVNILLRIREVPGLNLGQESGYPDWGFWWFSSVPTGQCRDSTLNLGHRFLPNPFQFMFLASIFHSTLYSYSKSYWKSVVKWTTNNEDNADSGYTEGHIAKDGVSGSTCRKRRFSGVDFDCKIRNIV
jgi:hypothetical protein